jgi:hypothetical protein
MKYYKIGYVGKWGQDVVEIYSEKQILSSYFPYWTEMMVKSGKGDFVNDKDCIGDWIVVNWATEVDKPAWMPDNQ